MKKQLFILAALLFLHTAMGSAAAELTAPLYKVRFNQKTGAVSAMLPLRNPGSILTALGNEYRLLSQTGDRIAAETDDRVLRTVRESGWSLVYHCRNRELPGLSIIKRYRISSNGLLERELEFSSARKEPCFLQLFTSSRFTGDYLREGYWFGAGYLGPYLPVPRVKSMRRVEKYVQSSKGMVFIHSDGLPSYTHYRTRINHTPVWPWWNSTIGSYREKNDRLYYLPDGWKMCLGTFDLPAGNRGIRIADMTGCFDGDMHDFYNRVYGQDPVVRKELDSLEKSTCSWQNDLTAVVNFSKNADMAYITAMLDEGNFLVTSFICGQWADYRWDKGMRSSSGGYCTAGEIREYFQKLKGISPRIKVMHYGITVAGTEDSPIFREHPEFFRKNDRRGRPESHFPGVLTNYQTRFQIPEVRRFMADTLFRMAEQFGLDAVYLDEAQQQNTIDWERGDVIRDDHLVRLFRRMRKNAARDRRICFYNGSGLPYADINYMEALRQMRRKNWRNFAGVAFGLELFSLLRPDSRIVPIGASYDSAKNDYSNRVVALGWLPRYEFPAPLSTVRAAREVGKTLPAPVRYAPDWKRDFSTDTESYAVKRRDSGDYIISFINRKETASDLSVELDLSSLDFRGSGSVNVWGMKTAHPTVTRPDFWLANGEYRRQVREYRWYDGFLSTPELLYSGRPKGLLKHRFAGVGRDEMVQLLVTASPAAIFSTDHLPMNYFFTAQKGIRIQGNSIISQLRNAEILLADLESEFTEIRLNGKPVDCRPADIGGRLFQVLSVPSGSHRLSFRKQPRTRTAFAGSLRAVYHPGRREITVSGGPEGMLFALARNGRTRLTSPSPMRLPEQFADGIWQIRPAGMAAPVCRISLSGGRKSAVCYRALPVPPPRNQNRVCNLRTKGLHVTRAASQVIFRQPLRSLQENLEPAEASADPEKLLLRACSTRREDSLDARFYAGLEISGADELALRLKSRFFGQYTLGGGYENHVYGSGVPKIDFSGLVIDYRVKGKYTRRTAVTCGIGSPAVRNALPSWGCGRQFDRLLSLGNLIDRAPVTEFRFSLADHAPKDWDGTVFFSIGNTHILPDRGLEVEILGKGSAHPELPLLRAVLPGQTSERKMPGKVSLGRLSSPPDPANILSAKALPRWSSLPPLQPVFPVAGPLQQTRGTAAYDQNYLYLAAEASENARELMTGSSEVWNNDSLELYLVRPDGALLQLILDASGGLAVLENRQQVSSRRIIGKAKILPGRGFRLFLALPWSVLGIREIYPGLALKYNLARCRRLPRSSRKELSCTAPVKRLFRESAHFSALQLGRALPGIGKFEEFPLEVKAK